MALTAEMDDHEAHYNPATGTEDGTCRDCGKRCAPHRTLCRLCEEDRDMGFVPDDEEAE